MLSYVNWFQPSMVEYSIQLQTIVWQLSLDMLEHLKAFKYNKGLVE